MSKKLIAVAAAAALALTGLVGVAPANASVTLSVSGADSGDGTSALPYLQSVPVANILDTNTSINVVVTANAGDVITVTATGAVRILDEVTGATAGTLYNAASGTQSYTSTVKANDADTRTFIVYNTSTTAGTFQVSLKGATSSATGSVQHMKGVAGTPYNINVVAPTTTTTAKSEVTFTATDVYGNALENVAAVSTMIAANDSVSGTGTPPVLGDATWDATRKVYTAELGAVTSVTEFAYILTIPTSGGNSIADVSGLPKAKRGGFFAVNSSGVSTQVSTLTGQVAALTAQLAESRPKATSVTKKRFNTLARKWNAAFPSQKVALKK